MSEPDWALRWFIGAMKQANREHKERALAALRAYKDDCAIEEFRSSTAAAQVAATAIRKLIERVKSQ